MENSNPKQGRLLHNLFEVIVFVKGFNGFFEILIGFLFLFYNPADLRALIEQTVRRSIGAAPGPAAVNYLVHRTADFSPGTQYFIAIYFLFYGVVNLFLVVFLVRKKLWAYPAAISFFTLFIFYQVWRFYWYPSGILLFFTLFDIFLVWLTYLEYKRIKRLHEGT